jgi:hypothetical protein
MTRLRHTLIGIAPFCLIVGILTVPAIRNWLYGLMPLWVMFSGSFLLTLASGAWLAEWVSKGSKGEGNAAE